MMSQAKSSPDIHWQNDTRKQLNFRMFLEASTILGERNNFPNWQKTYPNIGNVHA
jgi:hypothetical protein